MIIDFAHLNKENYYKNENNEPKCNNPFPWGQGPTKCIVFPFYTLNGQVSTSWIQG